MKNNLVEMASLGILLGLLYQNKTHQMYHGCVLALLQMYRFKVLYSDIDCYTSMYMYMYRFKLVQNTCIKNFDWFCFPLSIPNIHLLVYIIFFSRKISQYFQFHFIKYISFHFIKYISIHFVFAVLRQLNIG